MSEQTPWRWERKGCQVKDRNGHEVAEISVSRIGDPELESRGQLFAAAPETKDQLAELVAAAEPFVAFAGLPSFNKLPDDFVITAGSRMAAPQLTAGQIRRLAAAVAAAKGE